MSLDFTASVRRAQAGDPKAFAELYSLVYKDLYRIALLNLNNQHDASDVVSDTVLEAYSSITKLRDEKAFKAWITKILTVKIKNKRREYSQINNFREELEDLDDEVKDNAAEIDIDGMNVMEGFKQLSAEERMVLSLSVVSGYKSEEIAKMFGTNANTVRSKVARAKSKLKQLIT
ncbi:MAG: RNA polymerase sigma factor [Oscillospiraceae bacterium]|nr:RNA polymerase sigma factor [Oscillospiraceae bacterium]MDY3791298.1 RNA polymerase sigma factor [Oscillospiraceae bacterium]MDY6207688.1 RNA polymerase sigma factor [Oscillospiraceae bacterium]